VSDRRTSKVAEPVVVTAPASPGARRGALIVVIALSVAFGAVLPFNRVPVPHFEAFIPIFDATFSLINLVTASLLLVAFRRSEMRAVLCIASGYLFTSLMAIAHMLSLPGSFSRAGLLGAEPQTSAWLETFLHAGLPLLVSVYALVRRYEGVSARSGTGADIMWAAASVVVGVGLLTLFASTSSQFILGSAQATTMVAANAAVWLLPIAALAVLGSRRPYSILDLWLMVVVFAWMFDGALSAVLSAGRFDLGFFAGRLFGLFGTSLIPVMLILEASRLYGRLDEALAVAEDRSAELARSREQLAQTQRLEAIGQLTGGVAHDFNNLLAVIIGNLELMQLARGDAEKIERLAQGAMKAAQRGERLVRQLLTYARRQITRPETVNPNQLIVDIENLMRRAIGEQIEMIMTLSPLLAPAKIDPSEFETAILNLVINSRDAMTGGGRITIKTQNVTIDQQIAASSPEVKPGSYVMIIVSDSGIGMTPAVLARAFDPFFTTKEVGKGSGLGLSQVYGFAKTAGGHVTIESKPGVGTTVKLYLPKSIDRPISAETSDETTFLKPASSHETILVVEDDEDVLQVAAKNLTELGYHVETAVNAAQALEFLRGDHPVDLLFSDVIMPGGMNGVQLAVEARRIRPELKVLLTSGYTAAALSREHGLPDNLNVVEKPYQREELAKKLRLVIGG